MVASAAGRRLWGWYFFDWASQPYSTLLMTFIFAPYVRQLVADGAAAQALWGYTMAAAGAAVALLAPLIGAAADRGGRRTGWVAVFSVIYLAGASGVWLARPGGGDATLVLALALFGLGLVAMEFATIVTNAMLPDLGPPAEVGRISGSGWAFGYLGGLLALAVVLLFLAEGPAGTTLLGRPPALGLDPATRQGTRFVGPFTALWYAIFMVPFFLWLRDPGPRRGVAAGITLRAAWPVLRRTLAGMPERPSFNTFLAASLFYRDALNGLYVFGGLYAAGVLGWGVTATGAFGIVTLVASAVAAWAGGRADRRFGSRRVILATLGLLIPVCAAIALVSRERVFGMAVGPDSRLPDMAFLVLGALIGGAGGALQPASRTLVCRLAAPGALTQSFALYALAGKATAFLAPLAVAVATQLSGSQQIGILPLIALFLLGLMLFTRVKPEQQGQAEWADSESSSSRA